MSKRPDFTIEQEYWMCDIIGDWYLKWKNLLGGEHYLGFAKEELKIMLCSKENGNANGEDNRKD